MAAEAARSEKGVVEGTVAAKAGGGREGRVAKFGRVW